MLKRTLTAFILCASVACSKKSVVDTASTDGQDRRSSPPSLTGGNTSNDLSAREQRRLRAFEQLFGSSTYIESLFATYVLSSPPGAHVYRFDNTDGTVRYTTVDAAMLTPPDGVTPRHVELTLIVKDKSQCLPPTDGSIEWPAELLWNLSRYVHNPRGHFKT
ncbi:MAG: hypothetical protein RLZZ436_4635 [Planctomycetota bacterium]|jgi:hypothetical protein